MLLSTHVLVLLTRLLRCSGNGLAIPSLVCLHNSRSRTPRAWVVVISSHAHCTLWSKCMLFAHKMRCTKLYPEESLARLPKCELWVVLKDFTSDLLLSSQILLEAVPCVQRSVIVCGLFLSFIGHCLSCIFLNGGSGLLPHVLHLRFFSAWSVWMTLNMCALFGTNLTNVTVNMQAWLLINVPPSIPRLYLWYHELKCIWEATLGCLLCDHLGWNTANLWHPFNLCLNELRV